MQRIPRKVIGSIRRRPFLWGGLAVAVVAAVVLWPRDDGPSFFTDEEIALLNDGGRITSERFADYDLVCLFGENGFGYGRHMGNTCPESDWPRLGVQKDGVCETYALHGLKGWVLDEYVAQCRRVADGFYLQSIDQPYRRYLDFFED